MILNNLKLLFSAMHLDSFCKECGPSDNSDWLELTALCASAGLISGSARDMNMILLGSPTGASVLTDGIGHLDSILKDQS